MIHFHLRLQFRSVFTLLKIDIMEVLFSLVGIALAISLYDYYTVKNWQQTTSSTRNNIVFDKRNKEYGAYVIRRDYDREMILILLSVILTISAGYGSYLFFKSDAIKLNPKTFIDDPYDYGGELSTMTLKHEDDQVEKASSQTQATVKAISYVVTDEKIKNKKSEMLDLDNIPGPGDVKGSKGSEFILPSGGGGSGGGTGIGDGGVKIIEVKTPTFDPDITAEFPGGREMMIQYLTKNLKYPEIARQLSIQGKCNLQFVINKKGEISDIRIMRSVPGCEECDQEATRVIKKMPNWKPAIKDGQKVDSYFIMPINFSLK